MSLSGITFGPGISLGAGIVIGGSGGGGGGSFVLDLQGTVAPSGTTLFDQSGNNNDFNWYGNNPYTGSAYAFGSSDEAASNSGALLSGLGNTLTIQSWVKAPNGWGGSTAIIAKNPVFALRVDASGNRLNLVKYNIADQIVSLNSTLATNTWYNICAIQNSNGVTYLINGVSAGTYSGGSQAFNSSQDGVYIGYDAYTGQYSNLTYGRVEVWTSARTVGEVLADWDSQKSAYGY